jgi:hypothetical protein
MPGRDRAASATPTAVTHFQGEFKDQQLALYTDGTRWAAADTPHRQDAVSEKSGIPDRPSTGEELVDSAGEGSSLLERLRRGIYQEGADESDVLEKDANVFHDVFSHPPTSSCERHPGSAVCV